MSSCDPHSPRTPSTAQELGNERLWVSVRAAVPEIPDCDRVATDATLLTEPVSRHRHRQLPDISCSNTSGKTSRHGPDRSS